MGSNKGITLVVLVVTIILLLILSGTAIYIGYNTMQNSAEQRFLNQLQEINEAVNMHSEDYESLELTVEEHTENGVMYNYVLKEENDFNKIGLYNITDTIYVNFKNGQVYSKEGINGKHTLKDFGIEYYKPTQEEKDISNNISFEITLEPQEYSWKYIVRSENIACNGNPLEGNLLYAEYKEDKNYEWKRVAKTTNSFELEIKDPGIYELKYRDTEGKESNIKEIYAYVKDGLQLYLDGEYNENYKHNETTGIWNDISGNKINGILINNEWNENYKTILKSETITFENTEEIQNINIEQIITNNNYNFTYKDGKYTFTANDNLDLYCFRIYNRELTEMEKQLNYKIDKIRYNITE